MSIRFISIRTFIPAVCLVSVMFAAALPSYSQQPTPSSQVTSQAGASAQIPAPPAASKEPDYPDPRSITFGIIGLWNMTYNGPDIVGGKAAANNNTYENLPNLGQPYRWMAQFEFSVPVTRTGTLHAEFERYHGWADSTVGVATFIDTFSFVAGDTMHTTYHIDTGRIYLDDLFFPHKFPVAKFRLKTIWGMRYLNITQTVDSSTEDTTAGVPGSSFNIGTNYIFYPEFGMAGEYALSPHVVFRVEGAGFAIPHHSVMTESSATLSFRKKNLEFLTGYKMLHFKTSPQKEEYEVGTLFSPFVGVLWHW